MAPIILALKKKNVFVSVCKTGQHSDMVDSVLKIFKISADADFSIMGQSHNLNDTTALLMQKFQTYYVDFKPDLVIVQGDTVSVFAAALAAFNLQIQVAHVEAGLRTWDLTSPWPEEGFRSMVTQISRYHFAPTQKSADNLRRDGVEEERIFITGNTVIDALYEAEKIIERNPEIIAIPENILKSDNSKSILITGHRRENFGKPLHNLCTGISKLAEIYNDIDFIFPVHLNPNVQKQVNDFFTEKKHKNIFLIEPQPYLEFVWLMKQCLFIITDSGGIQEEAPALGKPVLVMRDTTERPEGVDAGIIKLIGTSEESLLVESQSLISSEDEYKRMATAKNPYGDGKSAERIIKIILTT